MSPDSQLATAAEPEVVVRTAPWRGFDRPFAAIIAAVFLFNFGLARAIASRPRLPSDELSTEQASAARYIGPLLPIPKKKPATKDEAAQGGKDATEKRDAPVKLAQAHRATSEQISSAVRSSGLVSLLGSRNQDGVGSTKEIDELGVGKSFDQVMQEARAPGATLLNDETVRRGPDSGEAKTIDIKTDGAAKDARLDNRGPQVPHPAITFEPDIPSTTAGCDGKAIAATVRRNLHAIQHCYELEMKRNPSLEGKVVVRLTLGADGRASGVELDEDTVHSAGLARCLDRTFRLWTFPASGQECVVVHPFLFAPMR
jgi:hypothetical protein